MDASIDGCAESGASANDAATTAAAAAVAWIAVRLDEVGRQKVRAALLKARGRISTRALTLTKCRWQGRTIRDDNIDQKLLVQQRAHACMLSTLISAVEREDRLRLCYVQVRYLV